MIYQQQEILSLLLATNPDNDDDVATGGKKECCCPRADNDNESRGSEIPLEILVDHIAPFLDRRTYNSCLILCRRAREILVSSWWIEPKASPRRQQLPPWPRKLVSRDPSCRVRCLTFSEDNAQLACGCADGKIRAWDVRTGELQMPSECHWPDEAVVALAFSNENRIDRRLLASSSTDGTIRIWKMHADRKRPVVAKACETIHALMPKAASVDTAITTTTKRQKTSGIGDNNGDGTDSSLVVASCILCIPSDQAVSLHFSPDDSYLVSGHLRIRTADDVRPTSTIEIRDVRTGLRLRRLEKAGVPVGFLATPPSSPAQKRQRRHHRFYDPYSRNDDDAIVSEEEEHRLISTCGPNTCLKLWSWNRQRCAINNNENEHNHSPIADAPEHAVSGRANSPSVHSNHNRMGREQEKIALDGGRCLHQWFLDRFNTILPLPAATRKTKYDDRNTERNNNYNYSDASACEILVAVINEPSMDSFTVWNTSSPKDRKVFDNTSPYEIRFSPDGSKVASVDDFNTVKVWRISDGVLLKTFAGGDDNEVVRHKHHRYCNCKVGGRCSRTNFQYQEGENSDLFEDDGSRSDDDGGLFPVHELVFSKDSSTVAVISRWYNEIHLFST